MLVGPRFALDCKNKSVPVSHKTIQYFIVISLFNIQLTSICFKTPLELAFAKLPSSVIVLLYFIVKEPKVMNMYADVIHMNVLVYRKELLVISSKCTGVAAFWVSGSHEYSSA
jgi:hypothetical protein